MQISAPSTQHHASELDRLGDGAEPCTCIRPRTAGWSSKGGSSRRWGRRLSPRSDSRGFNNTLNA